MNCRKARLKIVRRSEGRLDPVQAALVEEHLAMCSACRSFAEADARTIRLLADLPQAEPRDGGWERLQERIQTESLRRAFPWRKPVLGFAAAILAAVVAFVILAEWPRTSKDDLVRSQPVPDRQIHRERFSPPEPKQVAVPPKSVEPPSLPLPKSTRIAASELSPHRSTAQVSKPQRPRKYRRGRPAAALTPMHLAKPDGTLAEPASVEVIAEDLSEEPVPESYPDMEAQNISSEMSDLIADGMSALVEASRELRRSDRENQL